MLSNYSCVKLYILKKFMIYNFFMYIQIVNKLYYYAFL